jgi:hypothetical protein
MAYSSFMDKLCGKLYHWPSSLDIKAFSTGTYRLVQNLCKIIFEKFIIKI